MSEYDSIYRVITPIGVFEAVFGEEDAPVEYRGDKVAILFFKNWLSINQISGEHGIMLNEHNLTPNELYGFCQPAGSGITVIPPLDDILAFAEQESMGQDEEQSKTEETNNMQDAMTMDAVSGVEKIELIKELSGIRSSLQSVESGIEKLSLVKRIKEIRELIGIKDPHQFGTENGELVSPTPRPNEPGITKPATIQDINKVMPLLKHFIGKSQLATIGMGIRGEEGQFFKDKMIEIANTIQAMPKSYETDGQGSKAVAYLHYFKGSGDWYITEKDMEEAQQQAFGLADLGEAELGYINIEELINAGVELDLHWKTKTIEDIQGIDSSTNIGDDNSSSDAEYQAKVKAFEEGVVAYKSGSPRIATMQGDLGQAWLNGWDAGKNIVAEELGKKAEFSVGDTVYMQDVTDENKRIPVNFRGYLNDSQSIVAWNGSQMTVETNRLFKDDIQSSTDPEDSIKSAFIAELEALKSETDINIFNAKLDDIAARIEQAGLMEALDAELNATADVLTRLLAAAEKAQ